MNEDIYIANPDYVPVQNAGLIGVGFDIEGNYQEYLEPKGVRKIYEDGHDVFYPLALQKPEERWVWKTS